MAIEIFIEQYSPKTANGESTKYSDDLSPQAA